jgi:hypothetical protein
MAKKPLLPFKMMPGSWGLRGKAYAEAEAEYLYGGEELEIRLAHIRLADDARQAELDRISCAYGHIDQYEVERRELERTGLLSESTVLELDRRHGRISDYDAAVKAVELSHPDENKERELALLEVYRQFEKLTEHEYEKARANVLEEPWVSVVDSGFDPSQGLQGVFFEFDWNEHWITYLRLNGYGGNSEEAIIDAWFSDVCRAQGLAAVPPPDVNVIPFGNGLRE